MKTAISVTITVLILAVLAGGGYWWTTHHGSTAATAAEQKDEKEGKDAKEAKEGKEGEEEAKDVVATVQTVPIRQGALSEDITVYGTVVPAPGAVQTVSVPFESHVLHVLVSEGQKVVAKTPLLEIEPSPETRLVYEQAENSFQSSQLSLQHIQEQFNMKFATNEQLLAAKQAFNDARLKVESLKKRGINGPRTLTADGEALVTKVNTEDGALVAAGNSMVDLVAPDRVEVRLGFEVEDLPHVKVDQPVTLTRVNEPAAAPVTGKIRTISHSVNPTTRLVDVFVAPPPGTTLFLEGYIMGRVKATGTAGLIVPRAAVLPEEDEHVLYTVKNGHAVKHVVRPGLENDTDIVVTGDNLTAGQPVIILGNYELTDGMAVTEVSKR